jgi:hypothetical protein
LEDALPPEKAAMLGTRAYLATGRAGLSTRKGAFIAGHATRPETFATHQCRASAGDLVMHSRLLIGARG